MSKMKKLTEGEEEEEEKNFVLNCNTTKLLKKLDNVLFFFGVTMIKPFTILLNSIYIFIIYLNLVDLR